jgi:hypothetical protein
LRRKSAIEILERKIQLRRKDMIEMRHLTRKKMQLRKKNTVKMSKYR